MLHYLWLSMRYNKPKQELLLKTSFQNISTLLELFIEIEIFDLFSLNFEFFYINVPTPHIYMYLKTNNCTYLEFLPNVYFNSNNFI